MSSRPLLSQGSETDENTRLRREIAGLEKELADAKEETRKAVQASADALHAIHALRKQTEPLYTALKMIHGEISRVDADSEYKSDPGTSVGIWQERIAKVSGPEGRILQVLLDGRGPMSLSQVRAAAGTSSNTSSYLSRLYAKNWVQKVAHGSWALK